YLLLFHVLFTFEVLLVCVFCFVWSFLLLFLFFLVSPPYDLLSLSLHDALPICGEHVVGQAMGQLGDDVGGGRRDEHEVGGVGQRDRKSTRLNSSHVSISYAIFCVKKKIE